MYVCMMCMFRYVESNYHEMLPWDVHRVSRSSPQRARGAPMLRLMRHVQNRKTYGEFMTCQCILEMVTLLSYFLRPVTGPHFGTPGPKHPHIPSPAESRLVKIILSMQMAKALNITPVFMIDKIYLIICNMTHNYKSWLKCQSWVYNWNFNIFCYTYNILGVSLNQHSHYLGAPLL